MRRRWLGDARRRGAGASPYERPPLTKGFLRGEVDAGELTIEPEAWFDEHEVELMLGERANRIDAKRGTVTLSGRELARRRHRARHRLGACAASLPGVDHPLVLTMRTLPDSERLAELAEHGRSIVVVGTGFIGCEIAGSLAREGIAVMLVSQEKLPRSGASGPRRPRRSLAGWASSTSI